MIMNIIKKQWGLTPLLFLSLALASCAYVGPYVDPPEADPMPEGPGLFTGETGSILIGGKNRASSARHDAESGTLQAQEDFVEFEAYQRWKNVDRFTDEYKEFQQWFNYKEWKSQQ